MRRRQMTMGAWIRLMLMIGAIALGCSSALEIQIVSRPDWPMQRARHESCDLTVHDAAYVFGPECTEIADVFVGDTALSIDCGFERVIDTVRDEACKYGADAAQIIVHYESGEWTGECDQVRARLLVCYPWQADGDSHHNEVP